MGKVYVLDAGAWATVPGLDKIGIDEVRDAIAERFFPKTLGRHLASQLEALTLRKLINKVG